MVFEFLASLSWREVLLAVVVLLAIYILFAFLRIHRLRREARLAQELSPGVAQSAVQSYAAVQESSREAEATPDDTGGQASLTELSAAAREQMFAWNERHSKTLELRRKVDVLEQEIAQLRREIGGLRAEVQTLREEQRREISKVKITQSASPFYSDAMQLATQGREAADISVLCGISRAEAELVVALARNDTPAFD
jgi:ABC-type multidrug transport system fused ATPase/permease subunit